MDNDQPFRLALIVFLLVLFPIGFYYRIRSQATREKLDRRQEGTFILVTLRPLGAALWFGVFAWLIDPDWMAWSQFPLSGWLRWTGVALAVAGGGLLLWTFHSLGKNLTDTVVTRRVHMLVFHGPYRWIRHPLYTAVALLVSGMSLIAANWFFLATGIGVFILLAVRTRTEEANLVARFGDSYRDYMSRTARFVPRLGKRP